ncbi:MAG: DUF2357 domain-containing protein [Clostridium saudiense]|uniref:DUF2357 domain-containing protein n=1 Tax=Clostridium saudiense TaxID=1414720 RepID=UPI002908F6F9|nr:DUF2357 domain-containing protein [Clostridium saudiense]MDU3520907.1 DUF2357 domain-containing protein [Clostridium saudiense]
MKLIAHMINVSYCKSIDNEVLPKVLMKKYSDEFLGIRNIKILPEDDYVDGTILGDEPNENWIIETHYMGKGVKSKKAIYQIAFQPVLEKNESLDNFYLRLRASKDSTNIDYLRYCNKNNLFFYSEPKQKKKEKYCSVANTAGKFIVEVVRLENNTVLKSIDVIVKPSSLTYDDYLKMIRDLREIREDIVINNNSKISVGQRYINKKDNVEKTIKDLEAAINKINNKPKSKLEAEYVKKKYNQINKITNKTLLEKSMYPYKNSFTAIDYKESFNIYENRILKQVLINLKEKIKEYEEFYEDYVRGEERENAKIRERFKKMTKVSIEERKEVVERKKLKYTQRFKEIINENIRTITSNAELIVFKNEKINKDNINIKYDSYNNSFILRFTPNNEIKGDELKFIKGRKNIYGQFLDISLRTNNINEMIFFIESLEKRVCIPNRTLRINLKINMSNFNVQNNKFIIDSIYSIDGFHVKSYSEEEKREFFERYFDDENDEENLNMLESIIKKEKDISSLKENFKNDKSWELLKQKVDNMINLPIFKDVKHEKINVLRPSQIFVNDNYYRKAYKAIKKYNEKVSIIDMKSPESILVKSTCDIYEIWCLFKIVQLLIINQKWILINDKSVLKDIDCFFYKKDIYKEKKVEFKFTKLLKSKYRIDLSLIYEGQVKYDEDKYKTPDYQLIYTVINEYNQVVDTMRVYLDAKYRNYINQGYKAYNDDIKNVAIDKYIKTFEETLNNATCSMIVHSHKDEKYVNWGGDNIERVRLINETNSNLRPHGYGAFYLIPSDLSNLNKFLRLLPEYHLNINCGYCNELEQLEGYHICWQCGEVENIDTKIKYTKGGNMKYHYSCKNCNEFWVKNHCFGSVDHKLIKHRDNYHLLNNDTSNPWHLICPICGNGRV